MTTLDGVERRFDADSVLVCDRDGPSGVAGIMGGASVGGLRFDHPRAARGRDLERGQHPAHLAQARTALRGLEPVREAASPRRWRSTPSGSRRALIVELCGAKLVPGTIDAAAEMPAVHRVRLRAQRAEALLGMRIEPELCAAYLSRLGFGVERADDVLTAEVPAHRYYDVSREADLVEEVGRIHGYERHLPATLPRARAQGGGLTRDQRLRRRAEDVMRDLGFDAVVTLSLVDPGADERLRLEAGAPRRRRSRSPTRCRWSIPSFGPPCWARFSTRPATTWLAAPSAPGCSSPAAST